MPGYSPDIGQCFDVEKAKKLLAEAGYPAGLGFPVLKGLGPSSTQGMWAEISQQWRANLGIEAAFEKWDGMDLRTLRSRGDICHFVMFGFTAEYPDPDNILRTSDILGKLRDLGWQDADYDRLVEEAACTTERAKRMAMYRQADRYLVEEQALVLPIPSSRGRATTLVKPWVKHYERTPLGRELIQNIIIEDH